MTALYISINNVPEDIQYDAHSKNDEVHALLALIRLLSVYS